MSHPTHVHDDVPDEHESKRSRVETQKKQRVERLAAFKERRSDTFLRQPLHM